MKEKEKGRIGTIEEREGERARERKERVGLRERESPAMREIKGERL